MYVALTTRYVGPTNTRGSRVIVSAGNKRRLTVEWNDRLNAEGNHRAAARALADQLGWPGELVGGWHDDTGLWVFINGPYGNG